MTGSAIPSPFPATVAFAAVAEGSDDGCQLHPSEEELLHPRAAARRRTSFRLGRVAAHKALAELGCVEGAVLRGSHREPLWPDGVIGTITHTADRALAAVAHQAAFGGIGMDLERRRPVADLVDHIAFGSEAVWISGMSSADRERALLGLFSAKESIYKAFFPRVGQFFGLDVAELVWDATSEVFAARLVQPLDEQYPPDRTFEVPCSWFGDFVLTSVLLARDHPSASE